MTAAPTKRVVCPDCNGSQEIETGERERDTGAAITAKCPHCIEGEIKVVIDICDCCGGDADEDCECDPERCENCNKCENHCICNDDGRYEAADAKFTAGFEERE